ncbi:MAG: homoserine O-succinyltransferase [Acidaminobacteraceae bacterium]
MPVIVPKGFPAYDILSGEGTFLMDNARAASQDIRALEILVLNIMPTKIVTETQLLRLISNCLIQVNVTFIHPRDHISKNTNHNHLEKFYKTFDQVKDRMFDGLIITGAPVENLEFEEVDYWDELVEIMNYSQTNVTSTLHICWGAQAALSYRYGIKKRALGKKQFGIYNHKVSNASHPLLRGFDDEFYAPHSRNTYNQTSDIEASNDLDILAYSDDAGAYIVSDKSSKNIYVSGHCEYDFDTLSKEYKRDLDRNVDIDMPINYYPDDDSSKKPINKWRSHANLLYRNWINFQVYQETQYEINK